MRAVNESSKNQRTKALIDTGPIVAILSARDSEHRRCVEVLHSFTEPLITTWPVITEAHWLLRKNEKALEGLFAGFGSLWEVEEMDSKSVAWMAKFLKRYRNLEAQIADASLVFLAEKFNIATIFTLDVRDFGVYRFSGRKNFRILPR